MTPVSVHEVGADRADDVVSVIHAGFGARVPLDPPCWGRGEGLSLSRRSAAGGG